MGLQDWAWFERDGTQAMIINNDSEIIIVLEAQSQIK